MLVKNTVYIVNIEKMFDNNTTILNKVQNLKLVSRKLKELVANSIGIKKEDIVDNQYGKPYFLNSKIDFSISHKYPFCVIVFSDSKVGVDIEEIKKNNKDEIVEWTKKESLFKCLNDKTIFLRRLDPNRKGYYYKTWFLPNTNFCLTVCTNKKIVIKKDNLDI